MVPLSARDLCATPYSRHSLRPKGVHSSNGNRAIIDNKNGPQTPSALQIGLDTIGFFNCRKVQTLALILLYKVLGWISFAAAS